MSTAASFDGLEGRQLVPSTLTGFRQWSVFITDTGHTAIRSLNGTPWRQLGDSVQLQAECSLTERRYFPKPVNPATAYFMPENFELNYEIRETNHQYEAPRKSCRCGIYCLHFHADWTTTDLAHFGGLPATTVSGVVKAGGATVFGTLGFRTAQARIVAMAIEAWMPDREALRYSLEKFTDIQVYRDKRQMWSEHPADDFSSLFSEEKLEGMRSDQHRFIMYNGGGLVKRPPPTTKLEDVLRRHKKP